MIFGELTNAELTAKMPEINIEHPRSKHEGYVAIEKALDAAYKSAFCEHLYEICGDALKETVSKVNVCIWKKKPAGEIEGPAIVYGYPRYIREIDATIKLDDFIHHHIRNFAGSGIFILYDNNLYIREMPEPYAEDVIALATIYFLAWKCGKLMDMKEHLKAKYPPVYEKTLYVPTPRAVYEHDPVKFFTEADLNTVKKNGQGVDINNLHLTINDLDEKVRRLRQQILEHETKINNYRREIEILNANPAACPALFVIEECLKQLNDVVTNVYVRGGSTLCFTIETALADYQRDDWARQLEEPTSNLNRDILKFTGLDKMRGIRFDNNEYKAFVKKLFKLLFVDEKYRLLITNTFEISLFPHSWSWTSYTMGPSPTGYTNPHLFWWVCWSEAHSQIDKCFRNRNYDQIPLFVKSAAETICLGNDMAPKYLAAELYKALAENNPNRVFIDKDGYSYTIRELFENEA